MANTTGLKVGLALSGAVARGFTHVGILRVLEREGIPIDVIAGTSAGSLLGALYAAGVTLERIEALIEHFSWWQMIRPVWPSEGWISFAGLERWLEREIGRVSFGELKIRFGAVATDLQLGEAVTLRYGRVSRSVRASCSVPGFVAPVHLDGRILCDGGVSANIPVAAARELGADIVIGVDLFEHHIRRWLGPFGFGFAAIESMVRNSGGGRTEADVLITPPLAGHSYLQISNYKDRIQLGVEAAEKSLPEIRALLSTCKPREETSRADGHIATLASSAL